MPRDRNWGCIAVISFYQQIRTQRSDSGGFFFARKKITETSSWLAANVVSCNSHTRTEGKEVCHPGSECTYEFGRCVSEPVSEGKR
jgi:hypothetical protein